MSIFYTLWRTEGRLIIPEHVINGILSSLVAITPACASVTTWAAFPIGAVGALVGLGVNTFVCHKKVDDPVGAIGVHAGAGAWGLIAVGFFADSQLVGIDVMDGLFFGGGFKLLGVQLLVIVATTGWAVMWSTCFFYLVGIALSRDWKNPRKGLRVDLVEEERGADWHLHGVLDKAPLDIVNTDGSISSADEDPFADHGGWARPSSIAARKTRPSSLTRKSDMYIRSAIVTNPITKQQLTKEENSTSNEKEEKVLEADINEDSGGEGEQEGDMLHSTSLSVNDLDDTKQLEDNNTSHTASQRLYNSSTPMGLPRLGTARHNRSARHSRSPDPLRMSTTSTNSNNRRGAMHANRRISGEREIETHRESFRLYR